MVRCSNNLIGILNVITFFLSIPIIVGGVWLRQQGDSECEKFLDTPVIILGVFLLLVSIAGIVGAFCRVSWLLWIYLLVMFLLIVVLFAFTIFAFVVTNKGAGKVVSERGYKEYRLGDYNNWLQKRVNSTKNWNKIRSCLVDGKVCSSFSQKYIKDNLSDFYKENLNALQSGCCKPADECGYTYQSPTVWNGSPISNSSNPDCSKWRNDPNTLCFDCQSCKAGLLDNLKSDWKKVAVVNIVFLVALIIVYSVGCCAFRNNRRDDAYWKR